MSGSVSLVNGHIDPDKKRITDKQIIQALNTATNIDGLQICCIDYENNPKNVIYLSIKSDILDLISRQQAEIEELKKVVIDDYASENDSKIRAEPIKEFAERLKLKIDIDLCEAIECSDYLYNLPKLIDNLVKEMVGEQR